MKTRFVVVSFIICKKATWLSMSCDSSDACEEETKKYQFHNKMENLLHSLLFASLKEELRCCFH